MAAGTWVESDVFFVGRCFELFISAASVVVAIAYNDILCFLRGIICVSLGCA